ncbi:MAG TPA: EpsI family protein, partial [Opitutus sp.]|nr:EpsI family protein [Opitutus sp.]
AIPLNVLDSLGFWLRLWVVDAAGVIAHVAGIDVVRSGTQLFSPGGQYQYDVAAACSGVRSLMALAALSLLIGYLEFRSGWRRALMLALCLPLTYLGNIARIAAIILAAEIGGQAWGERAHDVMGFGVFAIVLGGVLGAARLMRRGWPERGSETERAELRAEGRPMPPSAGGWWAAGLVAIVVLAVTEMVLLARIGERVGAGAAGVRLANDGVNPVELPAFVGTEWIGRRAEVTAVEREILPADTGFSRRSYVHVQGGRHSVFVSIVLSGRDRSSIHRPELCLVGQGWTLKPAGVHAFSWPGGLGARVPATLLRTELIEPATGRKLPALVAYWFVNSERVLATHWERALWDAWNRVRRGRADRWAYVLVQADAADGEAAALARMQAVLDEALPVFQAVR